MKEHPILFSARMAIAIRKDLKTQTRRLITERNTLFDGWPMPRAVWPQLRLDRAWVDKGPSPAGNAGPYLKAPWPRENDETVHRLYPRVQPGDRLWVRETWRTEERVSDGVDGIRFRADDEFVPIPSTTAAADLWIEAHDNGQHGSKWRPSIFMPRWASRITLEILSVRVERLQEISEEEARAEGANPEDWRVFSHRGAFNLLWDSINGKRKNAAWSDNPWVWVLTFRRVSP